MENRWISIKEALPEENMSVYVTVPTSKNGKRVVIECAYDFYNDNQHGDELCFCDYGEYYEDWHKIEGVIAWMPILSPEPYQGD